MELKWVRRGEPGALVVEDVERCGVHYLEFPLLASSGLVSHGFATRLGGVSQGKYASMNLSFTRGDDPEHVRENYRRMAEALDVDMERMVLTYQTHTTYSQTDSSTGRNDTKSYRRKHRNRAGKKQTKGRHK